MGSEATFADGGGTSLFCCNSFGVPVTPRAAWQARVPGEDEGVSARLCAAFRARGWDTRRVNFTRLNRSPAAGGGEKSDCLAVSGRALNLKPRSFSSFAFLFPRPPAPRGLQSLCPRFLPLPGAATRARSSATARLWLVLPPSTPTSRREQQLFAWETPSFDFLTLQNTSPAAVPGSRRPLNLQAPEMLGCRN